MVKSRLRWRGGADICVWPPKNVTSVLKIEPDLELPAASVVALLQYSALSNPMASMLIMQSYDLNVKVLSFFVFSYQFCLRSSAVHLSTFLHSGPYFCGDTAQ